MGKISLNKVMLIGNVGKNPDQKYLPNGSCVSSFPLATNETFGKVEYKKERNDVCHKTQPQ